ncbi:MAG: squalene/phytoene synthase family protein [Rhodospirillaceae bacterium]
MSDHRLSSCGQEARRADHDRYLTCLFAAPGPREALFALLAFNAEIARIRDLVREPMMGRIRLQWWRETIDRLYRPETPLPGHPVAGPLGSAIRERGLGRGHFETLIDARETDLEDQPPATLAALTAYAEASSAPLVALFLEALGAAGWPEAGRAAALEAGRQAGIAWALTGLVRALPFHAARRRAVLPAELFGRHRITPCAALDRSLDPAALAPLVAEIVALARSHLARARQPAALVPKAALPALLLASLADLYLDALERAGHDVTAPRVQRHPLRPLVLSWRAFRGRY